MHMVMRGVVLLCSSAVAAGCGGSQAGVQQIEEADHAFVGVNVIPMSQEGVVENQTVVVHDGLIVATGPADGIELPDDVQIIDGTGQFLMPGLAEMHAHVPPTADPPRELLEDIMFLYIANGVTTIRGMLGAPYQIGLADELESGEMLGPTLYVAAPSLNGSSAPEPDTAAALVRAHEAAGYDLLKIHPGIPLDAWDALARTANEVGITFAGHVPADVGLLHALETGMSCVDHLDGYVEAIDAPELEARLEAGEDVPIEEIRALIPDSAIAPLVQSTVASGAYVVPTMYLWDNLFNDHDPQEMVRLPEMQYVSQTQRDNWVAQSEGRQDVSAATARMVMDTRRRILDALNDAGVGILMGTDSPQLWNVPGFALHREIRIYEDAGMSRHDILTSGTTAVARYVDEVLGLDGEFGTVETGKRADLVLLGGNPLESLDNLEARAGVMVRGRWISGEEIEAGLEALAAKHADGM